MDRDTSRDLIDALLPWLVVDRETYYRDRVHRLDLSAWWFYYSCNELIHLRNDPPNRRRPVSGARFLTAI